jgi:hypothetical protein
MVEPAVGIRDGNGPRRLGEGAAQGLTAPRLGRAQGRLGRRPAWLDRRPSGRVRRQGPQPGTSLLDRLTNARRLVRAQVIHDHEVPRARRRPEHLRHLGAEHLGIGGAVNRHHRLDAVAPQGRQHGHVRPLVLRGCPDDPLPEGRSAIPPGHGEGDARCIDELEARGVERRDAFLIGRARPLDARGVARSGRERLFLRGSCKCRGMRPRVGPLTRRPCCPSSGPANSASVASGCSRTSRRTCAQAVASQRARRPPASGRGLMSPVARRRRRRVSTTD